ncbi:metallophosphoesterase family protein [Rubrobacter marinus]|uniref:metallophosphoesterase family protein n=1 Tax=Rubrobacter marinus TaxID=2653852 RepID=UPI00389A4659
MPEGLAPHLREAGLILHAGDLLEASVIEELSGYAPVRAVKGNVDGPGVDLPEVLRFEVGGVPVAMIHDSGAKKGRRGRMGRRFPGARVVVFGHSHIPLLEDEDGLMLLNPGSPTDRRRQPEHTFALLWAGRAGCAPRCARSGERCCWRRGRSSGRGIRSGTASWVSLAT